MAEPLEDLAREFASRLTILERQMHTIAMREADTRFGILKALAYCKTEDELRAEVRNVLEENKPCR